MEYKKRYLINIRTKNIHDTLNIKPRCKVSMMKQDNALFYDTLQEALEYPNKITPKTSKCKFCFKE